MLDETQEKSKIELTLEAIQNAAAAAATKAVTDGMAVLKAEQESAEGHNALEDPLVKTAIEQRVDEQVNEKMAAIEAKWQLERDRAAAEDSMVQPGAAKHVVEDLFPNIKTITRKAPAHLTDLEKQACSLHGALYIIHTRAKDPEATGARRPTGRAARRTSRSPPTPLPSPRT